MDLNKVRNIGISAHIDSGKTTLSERILFYAGRIHKIEEVKGGGDGAVMDHMELEKERGITITSAATSLNWDGNKINLIDTPGHVDFTVEVERSLRVLDGAILVLCSVGGVQAQSLTVDRQMKRYGVPRLGFINKMDRTGADPYKVCKQMKEKLATDAILMQIPMGAGETFEGCIDLIKMKAYFFEGANGEKVREEAIPAEYQDLADEYRQKMIEGLAMFSDDMMEMLFGGEEPSEEMIHEVTKKAALSLQATPVFVGSAYKNKGVQLLLDAVNRYLPSPLEREVRASDWHDPTKKIQLEANPTKPFVGMAFKIVDDEYGQLTFLRVYQGVTKKGETYFNQRTRKKERFSRIVRMHADRREEVDSASAGDIVAIMGIDSASGDTYGAENQMCTLESIFVPEPVIKIAIEPKDRSNADRLSAALQRFRKEDPTFRVSTDEETAETIIAGMGELHLEVYVERIRREYKVEVTVGAPKVSYREKPTRAVEFNHKHRKQTGGSGQFAHIVGSIEPLGDDVEGDYQFEESIVSGRIPRQFIPAVDKGFASCMPKGTLAAYPVVKFRIHLTDGSYHDVDSSEMAFQTCARGCFREYMPKTNPVLLEPVMTVEIEVPDQFQGPVVGDITRRRGLIVSTDGQAGGICVAVCEVPLSETFGYATDLRSMTQGQGTFTMELKGYRQVPTNIQLEIIEDRKKSLVAAE